MGVPLAVVTRERAVEGAAHSVEIAEATCDRAFDHIGCRRERIELPGRGEIVEGGGPVRTPDAGGLLLKTLGEPGQGKRNSCDEDGGGGGRA